MDGGIEEEWDAYLQQLDAMGLQEYISIQLDAYNAYQESLEQFISSLVFGEYGLNDRKKGVRVGLNRSGLPFVLLLAESVQLPHRLPVNQLHIQGDVGLGDLLPTNALEQQLHCPLHFLLVILGHRGQLW